MEDGRWKMENKNTLVPRNRLRVHNKKNRWTNPAASLIFSFELNELLSSSSVNSSSVNSSSSSVHNFSGVNSVSGFSLRSLLSARCERNSCDSYEHKN